MASKTAQTVITETGFRLKILAANEAFDADEQSRALTLLNDMMRGFPTRSIQYGHTDLASGDTVKMPDEQLRNLELVFMADMAVEWGVSVDPLIVDQIKWAEHALQAYYMDVKPSTNRDLVRRVNNVAPFNITRGY